MAAAVFWVSKVEFQKTSSIGLTLSHIHPQYSRYSQSLHSPHHSPAQTHANNPEEHSRSITISDSTESCAAIPRDMIAMVASHHNSIDPTHTTPTT